MQLNPKRFVTRKVVRFVQHPLWNHSHGHTGCCSRIEGMRKLEAKHETLSHHVSGQFLLWLRSHTQVFKDTMVHYYSITGYLSQDKALNHLMVHFYWQGTHSDIYKWNFCKLCPSQTKNAIALTQLGSCPYKMGHRIEMHKGAAFSVKFSCRVTLRNNLELESQKRFWQIKTALSCSVTHTMQTVLIIGQFA